MILVIQPKNGYNIIIKVNRNYHSQLYQLVKEGISDMHCMSDAYLAEDLQTEYKNQPK